MNGPHFPSDSPSSSSPSPPSPNPSQQEQNISKVAKDRLSPTPEENIPSLQAARVSDSSPVSQTSKPPLMSETNLHRALEVYDDIKVPPNTTFVLTCNVFDGVGDLEHMIHMAHHLTAMRKTEDFQVIMFLLRGKDVPETSWQLKLDELSRLNLGYIYTTPFPPTVPLDVKFNELKKKAPDTTTFCQIAISASSCSLNALPSSGFITEYGPIPKASDIKFIELLNLGFFSNTNGLWIKDDLVFSEEYLPLSDSLQKILFGLPLSDEQQKTWDVGCASLREDDARCAWIDIRLSQVKKGNHCALSFSPFSDQQIEREKMHSSAIQHGFDHCILVNKDGAETVIYSQETPLKRTLRFVHPFIDEKDFPALIQKSAKGSLGGSGDTSCVRGLLGEHPLFVDVRYSTEERWEQAVSFFKEKEFPLLAMWFQNCIDHKYDQLLRSLTPSLIQEWQEFSSRAIEELDTGPLVTRYIRRCALAAGKNGETVKFIESYFLRGKIPQPLYNQEIKDLAPKNSEY